MEPFRKSFHAYFFRLVYQIHRCPRLSLLHCAPRRTASLPIASATCWAAVLLVSRIFSSPPGNLWLRSRPRGRPVTGGQYRNRREIRLRVDWCCSRGSKRPPSLRTRSWHTGTAWNGTEHWNTRLCQPPAPRHRAPPSPRRRRRSTRSARAVRTRRSPRPAPGCRGRPSCPCARRSPRSPARTPVP